MSGQLGENNPAHLGSSRKGRLWRKLIGSVAVFVFSITSVTPAKGADQFVGENIPVPENGASFLIAEEGVDSQTSTLVSFERDRSGEAVNAFLCDSPQDANCSDYPIDGRAILPPCFTANDENCIASLSASSSRSMSIEAEFERLVSTKTYEAVPALNFIESSAVSLWSLQGQADHKFAVAVSLTQGQNVAGGDFSAWNFVASVRPYRIVTGQQFLAPYQMIAEGDPVLGRRNTSFGMGGSMASECAWIEDGACGVLQEFEPGMRIKLELRLTKEIGGWFRGRIKDPVFSVSEYSRTSNLVAVEAEPVQVPRLAYVVERVSDLTARERALVQGFAGSWERFTAYGSAGTKNGFDYIEVLREKAGDRAAGVNSFWNFASSNVSQNGNSCLSDTSSVLGLVTTNATVYDGGVPQFSNGFLNYKVAGLHYAPDGETLNLGTYDMVMRSDVARCLYGYSRAPVSATVTVTGADGAENVATTVISERDGWLKLAAYGFTFSEKEIKVRVTQPQTRTLTAFSRTATALTPKQKAEIRATVSRGAANPKFICTGIRLEGQPQALNTLVRKRAKAACDYAKSLNPKLSTFFQTKTTKAASFNGKVLVVSK